MMDKVTLTYQLKEGTETSYYLIEGEQLLPGRISLSFDEFSPVKSRKLPELRVGQLKGKFRSYETSPYFSGNGCIHTTIWKPLHKSNSSIIGTGDLKNTTSLLVFEKLQDGRILKIHLYPSGKFNKSQILNRL